MKKITKRDNIKPWEGGDIKMNRNMRITKMIITPYKMVTKKLQFHKSKIGEKNLIVKNISF